MEFIPEDPILEFLPGTLLAIRKIYNLEKERMDQSIDILEEWIKKQNHFVNKNFSRGLLERIIITCKGSVEKAKTQIDKLCTYKTLYPKFFISCDVKTAFSDLKEKVYALPLPKMTQEYERLYVIKMNDKPFESSHIMDFFRLVFVIAEYLKAHDYVNGFVIINDFRDVNLMELITKINLAELQQLMTIIVGGYGSKMKGIHIVTPSKLVDIFVQTFSSIIAPKLAKRIKVHPELESLHQVIDKNLLPVELGGKESSVKELQDKWMEVVGSEKHAEYLAVMRASCTDESLRQKDKFNEQYMDMPGSFRTLTVD